MPEFWEREVTQADHDAWQKRMDWTEALSEDFRRRGSAAVKHFFDGHTKTIVPSPHYPDGIAVYTPKPDYIPLPYAGSSLTERRASQ
jgi:hypothetical protein